MKKRLIASVTCVCLLLIMLLSSTLAWFTDQTEATKSTMTVGNVEIQQLEQYRDAEGNLQPWHTEAGSYAPTINPVVPENLADVLASAAYEINGVNYDLYKQGQLVLDKIVSVKNTGSDSALVRTVFAFEMMKTEAGWVNPIGKEVILHSNVAIIFPKTAEGKDVIIYQLDSEGYAVAAFVIGVATYGEALGSNHISAPSLLQFYLDQKVGNDFSETVGGKYEILALSQAVQTAGFEKYGAEVALNKAFGDANAQNAAEWFGAPYSASFKTAVTPETAQEAIWAAQPGDTIYLEKGVYGTLVLENADGSPKNGITIEHEKPGNNYASDPFSVGFIDLNGSENITIRGIYFDIDQAQPVYKKDGTATGYVASIVGSGKGDNVGAKNIVIDNCRFSATSNVHNDYVAICFEEQGKPTSRATDITVTNCYLDKSAFNFIRANYLSEGTVRVEGNFLVGGTVHSALNFTGNAANLIIRNNSFGFASVTGRVLNAGWNVEKAMLGTSRQGSNHIRIEVTGNTFINNALGTEGHVIELKYDAEKQTGYTPENCTLVFENNKFQGELTGMTEVTVPCIWHN